MPLKIDKGKISVELVPADVLKYFGINMPVLIDSTCEAISCYTGNYGEGLIDLKEFEANKNEILDAILYEVKTGVLMRIEADESDTKKCPENIYETGIYYRVFADGKYKDEFSCLKVAKNYATHLLRDIDVRDVSVIDSLGKIYFSTNHSGDD